MNDPAYYRDQADRARRLASQALGEIGDTLSRVARDFDEIAQDLETGAVEIRHPEMMPQNRP
jgi:hypothetical protein